MRKLLSTIAISTVFTCLVSGCDNESIEQRIRACDQSISSDEVAQAYRDQNGINVLMMASESGCLDLVRTLSKQMNVNEKSQTGRITPIFFATEGGKPEVVTALIEAGANVNALDSEGSEALQTAVEAGNLKVTEILLNSGANPNQQDNILGATPLHMAASSQRYELVKLLIDHGADPTVKAKRLGSAIDVAKRLGDYQMVKILVE